MTDLYIFTGKVLPERATLSIQTEVQFSSPPDSNLTHLKISIILNQVSVWVNSDIEWDIFDLRNAVKSIVQTELSFVGYLKGYAYDLEITRVVCLSRNIDYVFGIDIQAIGSFMNTGDLNEAITNIRNKTFGEAGYLIHRCLNDLISALKHPDDTGFFCYRAIEALRQHSAAITQRSDVDKSEQWQIFRDAAKCSKIELQEIKKAADPVRHGGIVPITGDERDALLLKTWRVVRSYLDDLKA